MNKIVLLVLLFVIGLSTSLRAGSLDPSVEKTLRNKLTTGLLTLEKDPRNKSVIHVEDLPNLKFETVAVYPLDLPTEVEWKSSPQTVAYFLKKSAEKSDPVECIFVKKSGKVVGFLTSSKSNYLDTKIGGEIQKIYDTVKDPNRVTWIYYNTGKFGKWLTFNVKDFQGENLTLVDNSGDSPPGYYFSLLSLKKVIERAYDL